MLDFDEYNNIMLLNILDKNQELIVELRGKIEFRGALIPNIEWDDYNFQVNLEKQKLIQNNQKDKNNIKKIKDINKKIFKVLIDRLENTRKEVFIYDKFYLNEISRNLGILSSKLLTKISNIESNPYSEEDDIYNLNFILDKVINTLFFIRTIALKKEI